MSQPAGRGGGGSDEKLKANNNADDKKTPATGKGMLLLLLLLLSQYLSFKTSAIRGVYTLVLMMMMVQGQSGYL